MKLLISQEASPVKVIVALSETSRVIAEFVGEEPYEVTSELANLIYIGYNTEPASASEEVVDEAGAAERVTVGNLTLLGEMPAVSLVSVNMEQRTDLRWDEALSKASVGLAWLLDQA